MKLNCNLVTAVLLGDGWHEVSTGSFTVDRMRIVKGGEEVFPPPEVSADSWFGFVDTATMDRLAGPMAHLLAVRVATP